MLDDHFLGKDENGYSITLDESLITPQEFDVEKHRLDLSARLNRPDYCFFFSAGKFRAELNGKTFLQLHPEPFKYYYENAFPKRFVEEHGAIISKLDNYFDETGFQYEFHYDPLRVVEIAPRFYGVEDNPLQSV
jgi:hypothetical protein